MYTAGHVTFALSVHMAMHKCSFVETFLKHYRTTLHNTMFSITGTPDSLNGPLLNSTLLFQVNDGNINITYSRNVSFVGMFFPRQHNARPSTQCNFNALLRNSNSTCSISMNTSTINIVSHVLHVCMLGYDTFTSMTIVAHKRHTFIYMFHVTCTPENTLKKQFKHFRTM